MNLEKILVIVDNFELINSLKEEGINSFVYPLKDYAVGFNNYYNIEEINTENSYLYINKMLNCCDIDNLKIIIDNLTSNIKGIIFNDLGLINILKNKNIASILYSDHFNTNNLSVNAYLEYTSSVVIANDITKDDIKEISNYNSNLTSLFIFGYPRISYSRRKLLSNYNENYGINVKNNSIIKNTDNNFIVNENEHGTVIYDNHIYNGLELLEINAKYYLINSFNIETEIIVKVIKSIKDNSYMNLDIENTSSGFLHKKTIYKLKEDK